MAEHPSEPVVLAHGGRLAPPRRCRVGAHGVSGDGLRCGCGERSAVRIVADGLDYMLCPACVYKAALGYMAITGQPRFGEAATREYAGSGR